MSSKKLNLGCGKSKIPGYINIDVEPTCEPDVIHNFITTPLPYKTGTVEEVVMFHCIEHIPKRSHGFILGEIHRVLRAGGMVIFSYPEFLRCVENWKTNYRGKRKFWEATIYGRQLYPSDFHICIMDTEEFTKVLRFNGFKNIHSEPELSEPHNSIVTAVKGTRLIKYEDLIKQDMQKIKVKRIG